MSLNLTFREDISFSSLTLFISTHFSTGDPICLFLLEQLPKCPLKISKPLPDRKFHPLPTRPHKEYNTEVVLYLMFVSPFVHHIKYYIFFLTILIGYLQKKKLKTHIQTGHRKSERI